MNPKNLTNMSLDELAKQEKKLTLSLSLLAGIIFVMIIVCIYLTITQGFSVFTVLPITFLPLLVANFSNLKKIRAEILQRSS